MKRTIRYSEPMTWSRAITAYKKGMKLGYTYGEIIPNGSCRGKGSWKNKEIESYQVKLVL